MAYSSLKLSEGQILTSGLGFNILCWDCMVSAVTKELLILVMHL